jgi:hypothetical protein
MPFGCADELEWLLADARSTASTGVLNGMMVPIPDPKKTAVLQGRTARVTILTLWGSRAARLPFTRARSTATAGRHLRHPPAPAGSPRRGPEGAARTCAKGPRSPRVEKQRDAEKAAHDGGHGGAHPTCHGSLPPLRHVLRKHVEGSQRGRLPRG